MVGRRPADIRTIEPKLGDEAEFGFHGSGTPGTTLSYWLGRPNEERPALLHKEVAVLETTRTAPHRGDRELRILDEAMEFFDRAGLRWWADQGSALGAVRDGQFLAWDHDLDTSLFHDDFEPHRRAFIRAMHQAGFRVDEAPFVLQVSATGRDRRLATPVDVRLYRRDDLTVRCEFRHLPGRRSLGYWLLRSYAIVLGIAQRALQMVAISLATSRSEGSRAYDIVVATSRSLWRMRLRHFRRTVFTAPARFFEAFDAVNVAARTVPVPMPPEEYLEFKYGADWRVPRRDWVYWRDDGGLRSSTQQANPPA